MATKKRPATKPGDAEALELRQLRAGICRFDGDDLDNDAARIIGTAVKAWEARRARREHVLNASLRAALIDGPLSQSAAWSVIQKAGGDHRNDVKQRLVDIGATLAPESAKYVALYQRTSTREDRIDAVVLRMAAKSPNGVEFNQVLAAVDAEIGWMDGVELRKEVIDSAERCGRVPAGTNPGWIQLQGFDTKSE